MAHPPLSVGQPSAMGWPNDFRKEELNIESLAEAYLVSNSTFQLPHYVPNQMALLRHNLDMTRNILYADPCLVPQNLSANHSMHKMGIVSTPPTS